LFMLSLCSAVVFFFFFFFSSRRRHTRFSRDWSSDVCSSDLEVLQHLSALNGAPGRFERVLPGSKITAIVDYAHTPDALKNVLETIANFRTGAEQVITVVGCGGNRDKTKRPLMASIACKLSDRVVLTSDNPRDEDPMDIIRDMQTGIMPT